MRRNQISRPSIVGSTMSTLYNSEKRYQHVRLHPFFKLMKQWADGQLILEGAEGGFHFRQLHILLPKICSTVACQIRTQEISSLSCLQPLLLFRLLPPD